MSEWTPKRIAVLKAGWSMWTAGDARDAIAEIERLQALLAEESPGMRKLTPEEAEVFNRTLRQSVKIVPNPKIERLQARDQRLVGLLRKCLETLSPDTSNVLKMHHLRERIRAELEDRDGE